MLSTSPIKEKMFSTVNLLSSSNIHWYFSPSLFFLNVYHFKKMCSHSAYECVWLFCSTAGKHCYTVTVTLFLFTCCYGDLLNPQTKVFFCCHKWYKLSSSKPEIGVFQLRLSCQESVLSLLHWVWWQCPPPRNKVNSPLPFLCIIFSYSLSTSATLMHTQFVLFCLYNTAKLTFCSTHI